MKILLLLLPIALQGCASHKLSSEQAQALLRAEAQQIQIDSLRVQLKNTKEQLTQVIPQLHYDPTHPPQAPASLLDDLSQFLQTNDCHMARDKDYCYRLTLTRLIQTTQKLDKANMDFYAAQVTIGQLIKNIDTVVDSLGDAQIDAVPKK